MANSANYTATSGNRAPWQADNDTRTNTDDQASVANAAALTTQTAARARHNGVIVTPATATVSAGTPTQQLTAVVEAGVKGSGVTWTSSNPSKATVSGTGLVTRVAAGSTVITATSVENGKKTGYADITVS